VFASEHAEVEAFLTRERDRDLDYRMMKELCAF
jgi:nuclear transport factor 2 (NTF2) superfamily protein